MAADVVALGAALVATKIAAGTDSTVGPLTLPTGQKCCIRADRADQGPSVILPVAEDVARLAAPDEAFVTVGA